MWRILVLLGRIAVLTVVWTSAYLFECATAFMQCDANCKKYIVNLCGPEIKKDIYFESFGSFLKPLLSFLAYVLEEQRKVCTCSGLFHLPRNWKSLFPFARVILAQVLTFSLSFPPPPSPFTSLHLRSWSCSGMHFVTSSVSLHSLGEFLDSSGGSLSDRCLNLCPCLSCALIYVLNPKIFGSLLKRWY